MTKPILSIGMIFRDDIRSIERCLTALEPLRTKVPCELVMADTGSVDGSRAVAERFADILFDFPWIDDFSAARNAVIDRCTGQWFLSLDTDEYMDTDISELVDFLTHKKKQTQDFCGIMIRNYDTYEMDHDYADFVAVRMVRMSAGVRYKGAIHESWTNIAVGNTMTIVPLKRTLLHHDGYVGLNAEEGKVKRERNLALLHKELEESPEKLMLRLQLIESGSLEKDFLEQLHRSVELVQRGVPTWERIGPPIMRYAVMYAQMRNLPEMEEWLRWTDENFANSLYTRLDAAYFAALYYHTKKDFRQCIAYGEKYLAAQRGYKTGKADPTAQVYSVLKTASPYWEHNLKTILANACCEEKEYERALTLLRSLESFAEYDEKQIKNLLLTLKEIHRCSTLDTSPVITAFWEEISSPKPNQARADKRINAFFKAGVSMFKPETRRLDEGWNDVFRPSYTLFAPLDGVCELGTAAVIWGQTDPDALTQKLAEVNWERTPIHILAHALDCGAVFPPPEKPINVEEMDSLALRLAKDDIAHMPDLIRKAAAMEGIQALIWTRGLAMAAVKTVRWRDTELNEEQAIELAHLFALAERAFLPVCYTERALSEEGLFFLPPMHRFGWYCAQAFEALDSGDSVSYVRLLHAGLDVCSNVKDMVKFLVEHTPELQVQPEPSAELLALAEQVKTALARFAPDDPSVVMLKQSEAYKKVAYIIEGAQVPVVGSLTQ